MLHYYFGNGKGKSCSANGQILRAFAHDYKFSIYRFFKKESGEDKIFNELRNNSIHYLSFDYWIDFDKIIEPEKQKIHAFIKLIFTSINDENPDIILLDEFGYIFENNIYNSVELLTRLEKLKKKSELIITGHSKDMRLVELSDYCTEFKKHKHPFPQYEARSGIEF